MVSGFLLFLLGAPAPAEIPVRAGEAIRLDARVEDAEWADAFAISRDCPVGGTVRLRLKRTGPWLALALDADRAYQGEVLHLYATTAHGARVTSVILGLGQPTLPPALWRRTAPDDPEPGLGENPRACLVRVDVAGAERWSAEALLRLSALGIGRGDLRDLRGLVALWAYDPGPRPILTLPDGASSARDPAQYARLVSPDGWGAEETWPPVTPEESREFDDHDLLYRLCFEHEQVVLRADPAQLVIANAVRPRAWSRIATLRAALEAGRARNPTLPAWTYFLGRLLHEGNLYREARVVVESIPAPLRGLDPFARLTVEHLIDTEQFDAAEEVCRAYPRMREAADLARAAQAGRQVQEAEREAVARDEAKEEKNPRVRLTTSKGEMLVELFEDDAPNVVRNFMDLVLRRRFYDGLRFHEVHGGQLVVIGDPRTRLGSTADRDGPPWRVRHDRSRRGVLRGYLAALGVEGGVLHGSAFTIALAPLVGDTARGCVFGRVVEGMDVLYSLEQDDALEKVEVLSRRRHGYDPVGGRLDR